MVAAGWARSMMLAVTGRALAPFGVGILPADRGGLMKLSLVVVLSVLISGCSEPCVNAEALPGEQCGTNLCSRTGYCATDAGAPTCVSKKVPGTPCLRDAECIGGACELDGGCGPVPPSGSCG